MCARLKVGEINNNINTKITGNDGLWVYPRYSTSCCRVSLFFTVSGRDRRACTAKH